MQFESWGDIKDWLEDTIAEGTDISERVNRALYPFKFDYTLEEEMFRGNGDRYAIYHVDEGTPGKQHLFMNMAMVKEDGITIDAANYKCVYSGRLHEMKSWMICTPYSTIIHRQIIKHILCRSVM